MLINSDNAEEVASQFYSLLVHKNSTWVLISSFMEQIFNDIELIRQGLLSFVVKQLGEYYDPLLYLAAQEFHKPFEGRTPFILACYIVYLSATKTHHYCEAFDGDEKIV